MNLYRAQSGQVGLTVLLITVVLVTVGVSIASRSVTELSLTRQEEETTRALNIAESGAEQLLNDPSAFLSPGTALIGTKSFAYQVTGMGSVPATTTLAGHAIDVVLEGNDANGNVVIPGIDLKEIEISWSVPSGDLAVICGSNPETVPAVEISTLGVNGGSYTVRREAYDPCPSFSRSPVDSKFSNPTITGDKASAVVAINLNDKLVRIKSYFSQTELEVVATDGMLPVQAYRVQAQAAEGDDNVTRAVQVDKYQGAYPSVFDYALLSGTTIIK